MSQSHYSLRWNNHQTHILAAFDALLQAETLVDVTLVCAETSVRAHKVVLSACSPFFQRIFSENPCKHPVIVLKDFSGWEVQAIVDFMYKGEISVVQEQLQNLIKAAESLQVRGLANQDPFGVDKDSILNQTPTPSTSPNDFDRGFFGAGRLSTPRTPGEPPVSPFSPGGGYDAAVKLPHMSRLTFPENLMPRTECQSPLPRRKQARPRRRSGEMCTPQDLSKPSPPPMLQQPINAHQVHHHQDETSDNDVPENLCMKKAKDNGPSPPPPPLERSVFHSDELMKTTTSSSVPSPVPSHSPEMDLSLPMRDFRASPPVSLPPSLKQEIDSHSPLPFPPMPSVSALAMTPPHSKFFGLDSPLGLFPPGLDGCRNPLFDLPDPRTTPDSQLFAKKKMGRPKGQHSAPRGGPPRSWTNAELTEALQHVWNKKMTTSQASRIFGIPYNSLLMYVRGKYGKSLKLEQLRKDCIGAPGPMDLLTIGGSTTTSSSNNNNNKSDSEAIQPNTRPSSTEEHPPAAVPPPPPVFNPFAHSFYPDFGTGFPIPVNMIHLLPQSEKSSRASGTTLSDLYGVPSLGAGGQHDDEKSGADRAKDLDEQDELYRPIGEDRREMVHQNGQD